MTASHVAKSWNTGNFDLLCQGIDARNVCGNGGILVDYLIVSSLLCRRFETRSGQNPFGCKALRFETLLHPD